MIKLSKSAERAVKSLSSARPLAREEPAHEPINYDHELDECVAYFNRVGISLMDFSPGIRHKAFLIEQAITDAANANDSEKFMDLLRQWRRCFH